MTDALFPNYIVTQPNGESEYFPWAQLIKLGAMATKSKKYAAWLRQNNLVDLQKDKEGLTRVKFIYLKNYLETVGYKFEEA